MNIKCFDPNWIYEELILVDFKNNLKGSKSNIYDNATKYRGINVPKHRLYRANNKERVKLDGIYEEQYARI